MNDISKEILPKEKYQYLTADFCLNEVHTYETLLVSNHVKY